MGHNSSVFHLDVQKKTPLHRAAAHKVLRHADDGLLQGPLAMVVSTP